MKFALLRQIEVYVTKNGKKPFIIWLESFKDEIVRFRIKERLDHIAFGNMGDYKFIDKGVSEFRLSFGSGYRIYFAEEGNVILLLCGGDKSTQKRDIKKALNYWKDYQSR